jgi:inosine/xanthosine triphosphatase
MKIAVGTLNKGKVEAVRKGLSYYKDYLAAEVLGVKVDSGVGNQPIGLEETIAGAQNRARLAFESISADLGIGLESGIFLVPHTKSDYMDTTACAIYDGKEFHLGLSSCFEYPREMIKKVLEEGKDIGEVALQLGFSDDKNFAEKEGMIGILTKGVINRANYSEQAVHMAMIHLLNREHY